MSSKAQQSPHRGHRNQSSLTTAAIFIWALILVGIFIYKRSLLLVLPIAFSENVSEFIWNGLLLLLAMIAILRLWVIPFWQFIFPETKKLGQKIQWYEENLGKLIPESKKIYRIRWIVIFSIAVLSRVLSQLPFPAMQKWSVSFAKLKGAHPDIQFIHQFLSVKIFVFLEQFMLFSVVLWLLLYIEGRSRVIARFLKLLYRIKEANTYLLALPPSVFDCKSEALDMCLFTTFYDVDTNISLEDSIYEGWVPLKEAGLRTNTLIIGPTGGGKTSALIKRILRQSLTWQADCEHKKASIVVYDPKAELSDLTIKMANEYGRSTDLIVLELGGKHRINPIKMTEVWDGKSSWQVSGWIVAAWQNFQGRSNSEPYWETQNYILTRNLLVVLYMYHDVEVTLYDLSTTLNKAGAGCFNDLDPQKPVNAFGMWVLSVLAAAVPDKIDAEFSLYSFQPIERHRFTEEVKSFAVKRLIERAKTPDIENLKNSIKEAPFAGVRQELEEELKQKLSNIEKEAKESKKLDQECVKILILEEGKSLRSVFEAHYGYDANKFQIAEDACRWLLNSWSSNNSENRGSIISNMQPFLQQFETPELVQIFSSKCKDTLDFKEAIIQGKIIVPKFSGIQIGSGLSSGIITLLKSRWQNAALSLQDSRIKVQIMDEAQRILTLSDGNNNVGDLDYMELSRSFGGMTFLASQSIAALKARANREADWEKVHGVIRSVICLSTNDPITIDFMQKIGGKTVVKRVSRSISENANAPHLEAISEKYKGETDALSVSYTTSESLEEKIQAKDIQNADAFSGIAVIYDGKRNHLLRITLRPNFWPYERDRYTLLKFCDFDPMQRLSKVLCAKIQVVRFIFGS